MAEEVELEIVKDVKDVEEEQKEPQPQVQEAGDLIKKEEVRDENLNQVVDVAQLKNDDSDIKQEKQELMDDDDDDDIEIVKQLDSVPHQPENDNDVKIPLVKKQIKKDKDYTKYSTQFLYGKNIRDLFKQQKYKELVLFIQDDKKRFKEYDEVKYHGVKITIFNIFQKKETYKLNQNVMINNANNQNDDYIGKLVRIMSIKELKTQTFILLSEIKWYYKKNEIVKLAPQHANWISVNEVFATDSTDYILTTAINGPCQILSLEEFEVLENIESSVYFSRLAWQPKKNRFEGYEKLEIHCICKQPINPDIDYIQCDLCDSWYHMSCVGVRKGEWDIKQYVCGRCR